MFDMRIFIPKIRFGIRIFTKLNIRVFITKVRNKNITSKNKTYNYNRGKGFVKGVRKEK